MVTHFGNGCPVELPRHDNVLRRFLALREHLWFCFIPDGAPSTFIVGELFEMGGARSFDHDDRRYLGSLARTGMHEVSGFGVEVDEAGVARRPGSDNLAGSTVTMPVFFVTFLKNLSWMMEI